MKVLLVEDDPSIREGMTELVSELAEACPVASVGDALAHLEQEQFELVITDLRIGGDRDGGRKIVAESRAYLTPVAIISASTEEEIRRTLRGVTPDEILMKPFQLEDLLGLTDRFLERRREADRQAARAAGLCSSMFEELRPGMSVASLGRSAGSEVRWVRLGPGAELDFRTDKRELWVLVEGQVQASGVHRGPGASMHIVKDNPVALVAPTGALAVSLVSA
ncbi:MAG: response regulator [Myxococcaceae bacterium]